MQVDILSGIYTENADFRVSYPVNLVPVPKEQGISKGYLRPADGVTSFATGPGDDRGGIAWNDVMYRVMGTKLVSVSSAGVVTTLGDVGGSGYVTLDYSFDRLAIASSGSLFYWDGSTLTQVTDPDLGTVVHFCFTDGYFMTTDGDNLIVTELNDPTSVNPLKYGSSEADPDPVKALIKLRNEPHAVNRYTIEAFDNVGGDLFPYQRIEGAQIMKGAVGTFACCKFLDSIAFVGSGRNEGVSVYIGANGQTQKISTQEIDEIIASYTEAEIQSIKVESRIDKSHEFLYIRLPDKTLVFDAGASKVFGTAVWHVLTTTLSGFSAYQALNFVFCYGDWYCGYGTEIGRLTRDVSTLWGSNVRWEFGTSIAYNKGKGAIFHALELVALTGYATEEARISTSYSVDGQTWSQDRYISAGAPGARMKRLAWLQQGKMDYLRMQRFRGTSQAHASFARLEATVEALE